MKFPQGKSSHNKKNGFRRGKQSYRCKDCGCQFEWYANKHTNKFARFKVWLKTLHYLFYEV